MKFLVITDLHASNSLPMSKPINDGTLVTNRLQACGKILSESIQFCQDNNIKTMFILGDLFDSRYVDTVTLNYIFDIVKFSLEVCPGVTIYLMAGNHDQWDTDGQYFSSKILESKSVKILKAGVHIIEGKRFMAVPYSSPEVLSGHLSLIQRIKSTILLLHHDISGCVYDNEYVKYDGIDPEVFQNFKFVISGHYHKPQDIKFKRKVVGRYVGSALPVTFSDENIRGFCIFDTAGDLSKPKYKFQDIVHFRTVDVNFDCDDCIELLESSVKKLLLLSPKTHKFVRMVLKGKKHKFSYHKKYFFSIIKTLRNAGITVTKRVKLESEKRARLRTYTLKVSTKSEAHNIIHKFLDSVNLDDYGLEKEKLRKYGDVFLNIAYNQKKE